VSKASFHEVAAPSQQTLAILASHPLAILINRLLLALSSTNDKNKPTDL
jgi:hypothetical protein